jgi:hypothetical protein
VSNLSRLHPSEVVIHPDRTAKPIFSWGFQRTRATLICQNWAQFPETHERAQIRRPPDRPIYSGVIADLSPVDAATISRATR